MDLRPLTMTARLPIGKYPVFVAGMSLLFLIHEGRREGSVRILIVDDAMFIRHSLKQMLESHGHVVVGEADNGMKAVRKYKELRPDLVTMDITMPEMDGIKALKAIKQIDVNAKVIMISTMGQQNFVKEAILAGAKGFVLKPLKEEQLVKGLSAVCM